MEIGYFQLENLLINQVQFLFLDIRSKKTSSAIESLKKYMATAVPLDVEEVVSYLEEKKETAVGAPVVMICDSGMESQALLSPLENLGFPNVCYLAGGWSQVEKEASAMTHA